MLRSVMLLCLLQGGVLPEWEVKKQLDKLVADLSRLKPALEQLDPSRWRDTSKSDEYRPHWQGSLDALNAASASARNLTAQPEKLTTAVDLLLELDRLSSSSMQLSQGVRLNQNSASADVLDSVLRETSGSRQMLRQHARDVAAQREKELEVANQEAQRCREQQVKPGRPVRKQENE